MNRRRRNRKQRNGRPHFIDVESPTDQINTTTDVSSAFRQSNCEINDSPTEQKTTKYFVENTGDLSMVSPPKTARSCISVSSVSSSDEDGLTTQTNISGNQYADFTFWKPLLPTVDDEIAALLSNNQKQTDCALQRRGVEAHYYGRSHAGMGDVTSGDDGGTEFSEFNFWRVPIAAIDADLSHILGGLEL